MLRPEPRGVHRFEDRGNARRDHDDAEGDGTSTCSPQPCFTDSSKGGRGRSRPTSPARRDGHASVARRARFTSSISPMAITINLDGVLSCHGFGGYHASFEVGGLDVPYAIIPLCDPSLAATGVEELTVEETATFAASHGSPRQLLIRTAPSPRPRATGPVTSAGTSRTRPTRRGHSPRGKIADLCVDVLGLGEDRSTAESYVVQRVWSNSSAAGHDPCVPIPSGQTYFVAGPSTVQADQTTLAVVNRARSRSARMPRRSMNALAKSSPWTSGRARTARRSTRSPSRQ